MNIMCLAELILEGQKEQFENLLGPKKLLTP